MKKFFLLVLIIVSSSGVYSQEHHGENTKISVKAGLIFNPQTYLSLKHLDELEFKTPLYLGLSLNKKGFTVTPAYEVVYNSASLFVEKLISKKHEIGVYTLFELGEHEKIYNFGISKMIYKGGLIFFEVGSSFEEFDPTLYLGASVPLMLKI